MQPTSCKAAVGACLLVLEGMSMDLMPGWWYQQSLLQRRGQGLVLGRDHLISALLHAPSSHNFPCVPTHLVPLPGTDIPSEAFNWLVLTSWHALPWLCLTPCVPALWKQGVQVSVGLPKGKRVCCVLTLCFNADLSISAPLVGPLAANVSGSWQSGGNVPRGC